MFYTIISLICIPGLGIENGGSSSRERRVLSFTLVMERFVFLFALLASCASAATWGTKAFAFRGRITAGRGAFSLAQLICMQATFNRLSMTPTEVLIPHHSEVMEIDLGPSSPCSPQLGLMFMQSILARILHKPTRDPIASRASASIHFY